MSATGNNHRSTIQVGDVLRQDGKLLVCFRWSESGAAMRPLTKKVNIIKPRGTEAHGGKETKFTAPDVRIDHFSAMTPGPFVARLGENWMLADLKATIDGFEGEVNVPTKSAHEKAAEAMKKKETQKIAAPQVSPQVTPQVEGRLPQSGKTAYMVGLLLEGTHTKKFIVESAVAKFGGELLGTSRTLSSLPSIMKKAGKTAKWVEETK